MRGSGRGTPGRARPLAVADAQGGGAGPRPRLGAAAAAAPDARAARSASASSGRRCASCSRAGTPQARAGRSSGSWPRWILATCAWSSSPPRRPTRSAITSWRGSSRCCPAGAGWPCFDRSWYGRVLVERVEGFATREQWLRAYDEINGFERTLGDEGMILVKLWLQISDEEQLRRFERRKKRSAEGLEADRRGLAQPREAWRVRGGGRGHARPHRPALRALEPDRGQLEALRPREGDRDGDRAHRGGHEAVGDGAPAARSRSRAATERQRPDRSARAQRMGR